MAPDEKRELQELLRIAAGIVCIGSFVLIVLVSLAMPFLTDREPNGTLLLGLATSSLTAAAAFFGISALIGRNGK